MSPAPPVPARARPMMNMSEDFAMAQTKDPTSNKIRATRKTCYTWLSTGWSWEMRGVLWICSIDILFHKEVAGRP